MREGDGMGAATVKTGSTAFAARGVASLATGMVSVSETSEDRGNSLMYWYDGVYCFPVSFWKITRRPCNGPTTTLGAQNAANSGRTLKLTAATYSKPRSAQGSCNCWVQMSPATGAAVMSNIL